MTTKPAFPALGAPMSPAASTPSTIGSRANSYHKFTLYNPADIIPPNIDLHGCILATCHGLVDVNGGGEKVCLISVLLDRITKSLSTKGALTMANSNTTQSFGNLIGDMYARWTLDCVVEIAHAVSIDYVARPEFYRGSDVPDNIADLRSSYGYLRNYPNKGQRSDLNAPVLGASDGCPTVKGGTGIVDKFRQYREPLFKACIAYTERSVVDAASGLKDGVIQAMKYFPQYLRNFEGQSLQSTYEQLVFVSELSYSVLRSATVSGAFGVVPAPASKWPLKTDDQRGSQLISAISDNLQLKDIGLNQEKFTKLRAIAQDGSEALEAVLLTDPTNDQRFENLVRAVYSWAKSIDYYWWAPGMAQSK